MVAPLIKTLNTQGGTFISFISAARDITSTFNDENTKSRFSKFALLNIPDIKDPINQANQLGVKNIDGSLFNGVDSDNNVNLAESFQNYVLNFEANLINQTTYDVNLKRSVAERAFFKWLKETGAIRFRAASTIEKSVTDNRFTEEDSSNGSPSYSKVVQYIGDIQITNSVRNKDNTFSEIYIHVPSQHGNTPTVLFNTINDTNYDEGQVVTSASEYILGRDINDTHPSNLDMFSFYDYDVAISNVTTGLPWASGGVPNSFYTETDFTDASNINVTKNYADYSGSGAPVFTDFSYLRSNLDGISLDFDPASYFNIVNNPNISQISEFNGTAAANDFDFNAVAIYYDVFDVSNPTDKVTNLYGILFLDNITEVPGSGGYIQRFSKYKQNNITKLNGNSYGLKLNVKFDTSVDNIKTETSINDYNSFSLELYSDALNILQDSARKLVELNPEVISLKDRVEVVEQYLFTGTTTEVLDARLDSLEQKFNNANLNIAEVESLLDLIGDVSDRVTQIFSGEVSLNLQYNTDVIRGGDGITIDKNTPNQVKIVNTVQGYNSITEVNFDYAAGNNNVVSLGKFNNYVSESSSLPKALGVININIDDSNFAWTTGQVMRLSFASFVDMNSFSIIVKTDALDRFNTGLTYNKTVGIIPPTSFETGNDNHIFDVVCLSDVEYRFRIDQIR